ncbi:MAG: calcium channel protein [Cirrosporium novae-zelandiae]|nr:MAG: calcium channel protein [Cirrosporium novae-zelandiae]
MDSRDHDPQDQNTTQSIPLRDLSNRAGDSTDNTDDSPHLGRSLTSRARARWSGSRRSVGRKVSLGGGYERLTESSPNPNDDDALRPQTYITTSSGNYHAPGVEDVDDPLTDPSGFQEAVGSVGLSFNPGARGVSRSHSTSPMQSPSALGIITEGGDTLRSATASRNVDREGGGYLSPIDSDTTPLTTPRHLQPISGKGSISARSSFQSVHFDDALPARSPRSPRSPGARLGDDLANMEAGVGTPTRRSRSLSPSASPLSRAGTVMRNMSQRVVNLSNEPEVVESTLGHKSSLKQQARLEGPPSFPELVEYPPPQEPVRVPSIEKIPSFSSTRRRERDTNPLKGKSLGIFPPDNPLRLKLCDILTHPATEPMILMLIIIQTIFLIIQTAPSVFDGDGNETRSGRQWGAGWIDYGIFSLFVVYSLEIIARVIVSGFIINPAEYSTIDRALGFRRAVLEKGKDLFALQRKPSVKRTGSDIDTFQPTILTSFTGLQTEEEIIADHSRRQQRMRLARRAFLRHSFNRLDFVAVVSYWIAFGLQISQIVGIQRIYVFEMMSCLRIIRLLGITSGTSVILRSLKKAAPLLANVAFLISFFWLLFAIIGVQSFKSSFRRTCVWIGATEQDDFPLNNAPDTIQFCGGYLNSTTGKAWPWLNSDHSNGTTSSKGYLCPQGSICIEQRHNIYNNTVSFDNIFQSLELVFVVMTSNTFSDLLYYLADSDYLTSALFFAAGVVVMTFWLINLLIAVITSSFQIIREESQTSAFTGGIKELNDDDAGDRMRVSFIKRAYDKTFSLWITIIIYDLVTQCLRSATMEQSTEIFIENSETVVTLILLFEIIFRFSSDWRGFFKHRQNWIDFILAIITTMMQIPVIHRSGQPYAWLTIFQIARFYRIVLAFPVTRDLLMVVFGNASGFINLVLFVFLLTFLVAIFAAQILRGQFPLEDSSGNTNFISFFNIYNSFIGMYQILSSENWTTLLYGATESNVGWDTAWILAGFFILWYILANFIVLNMFIAVIQESFDVSEDEKRMMQVKAFLQQKELGGSSHGNLSLSSILKLGRGSKNQDPLEYGPASMEMLLKDAVVKEFLDDDTEPLIQRDTNDDGMAADAAKQVYPGALSSFWGKFVSIFKDREPNPFYSSLHFSRAYEDLDPRTMAQEVLSASEQRKKAQRQYLQRHPNYNVSLYIFRPTNPIRRFCQRIVGPGRGTLRIEGVDPIKPIWYAFSAFIYAAIVCMVILACITTPLYQRDYFKTHGDVFTPNNWFTWADFGFAIVFTTEAIIKVIADGFFWTPNAYFRGSWGFIDGLVLITLWINVITALYKDGGVSRAVGAFKALRAIRLLNVSDSARDTFHSVIILGGWKVLSAAFVSISLLFPFAIYGVNLFNGRLMQCNDGDYPEGHVSNCVGEYNNSIYDPWDVLSPRQVANPYYSFDDFASSLFILFQIVSQEGWVDVMVSGTQAVGKYMQPQDFANQGNAIFFIVFNLLGAVFVLTLFESVFMRNYTEQTGVAFLTADQRSWLELRKILKQIKPSKRPTNKKATEWRTWCYRIAIKKHGRWQKFITSLLLFNLLLELLEFYGEPTWWTRVRDGLMLLITMFLLANIVIRVAGLTWKRFRANSWDLFSVFAVTGSFVTTVASLIRINSQVYDQLHKLFLVSVTLLIIPRNNQLDQLFKTAAASLTSIGNLLATWFVLFLAYAIAFTQIFGLTKFGGEESWNINFRTVPKALILLFRMSCGEGWNELMEDFANITPPNCVTSENFFDSDCGSTPWARVLFISWNIVSMYIFVSLFVSLIYESFSYVYQRSSGLSAVSREEIRRFKQAWATFDPQGTGYISKEAFPRLLGELSGVFQMRIYDPDWSVRSILEDCQAPRRESTMNHRIVEGVDLDRLTTRLAHLPIYEVRRRRERMNIFYEEMLVSADKDKGISFTALLMIIAHYNVISDQKSLRLEEFLRRRARLQRVQEAVDRNIVVGFFDMLYWSREFRHKIAAKKASRMTSVPRLEVPEIFVDDQDDSDHHSKDGTKEGDDEWSPSHSPTENWRGRSSSSASTGIEPRAVSPTITDLRRRDSRGSSLTLSDGHTLSPAMSPRTGSPTLALDGHQSPLFPSGNVTPQGRSRQGSAVSAQGVMAALDSSAWGESIRRSFTTRRTG